MELIDLAGAEAILRRLFERDPDLEHAAHDLNETVTREPTNLEAHLCLSAVLASLGREQAARGIFEVGILGRPYIVTGTEPDRPTVLLLKGSATSRMVLRDPPKISRSGGNFNCKYLLDADEVNVVTYYVTNDNLVTTSELPPFDVIVNSIADVDRERTSLLTAETFVGDHPEIPLINRPASVLRTAREEISSRFRNREGIVLPRTERVALGGGSLDDQVARVKHTGLPLPILVRRPGSHTGQTLEKIETWADLRSYLGRSRLEQLYVTEFVDCPVARSHASALREPWYRRMRLFYIDGVLLPATCHFAPEWKVSHGEDCMLENAWMIAAEESFVTDPESHIGTRAYRAIKQLAAAIELDFFGIDFTVLEDGSALIYEANPQMRHSFDYADRYPYLRPSLEQISTAFHTMVIRRAGRQPSSTQPSVAMAHND